jgi:predicted DNA-binding transcriptional regulator AlpA
MSNMTDERRDLAKAAEVAAYLQTTPAHLANLRYLGKGPAWVQLGRSIRYRWADVDAWVAANVQNAGR